MFHEAAFSKISVLFFNSQTLSSLFLSSIHFDYFCRFPRLRSTRWLPFPFLYFTYRFYYCRSPCDSFSKKYSLPNYLYILSCIFISSLFTSWKIYFLWKHLWTRQNENWWKVCEGSNKIDKKKWKCALPTNIERVCIFLQLVM